MITLTDLSLTFLKQWIQSENMSVMSTTKFFYEIKQTSMRMHMRFEYTNKSKHHVNICTTILNSTFHHDGNDNLQPEGLLIHFLSQKTAGQL